MTTLERITSLTKQLYPRGRAFKMPINGVFEKLHTALSLSEARAYDDALSILSSALPDNASFTTDDATDWERRLGLITNTATPLSDRKLAIARKMNHPGTIRARQNYLYLQGQLQAAGFNVYVYENRFNTYPTGYFSKSPGQFSIPPYPLIDLVHSSFLLHGDEQHGGAYTNKVVNNLLESDDDPFFVGLNYKSTFFIGGPYPGEWASVLASRELEFRQLILKIKPVQTVGYLLINYI